MRECIFNTNCLSYQAIYNQKNFQPIKRRMKLQNYDNALAILCKSGTAIFTPWSGNMSPIRVREIKTVTDVPANHTYHAYRYMASITRNNNPLSLIKKDWYTSMSICEGSIVSVKAIEPLKSNTKNLSLWQN